MTLWCCPPCKRAFENLEERGFSVFLAEAPPLNFVLRHRAVDAADIGTTNSPVPLSLISETGISFCPWCGTDLARFYARMLVDRGRRLGRVS